MHMCVLTCIFVHSGCARPFTSTISHVATPSHNYHKVPSEGGSVVHVHNYHKVPSVGCSVVHVLSRHIIGTGGWPSKSSGTTFNPRPRESVLVVQLSPEESGPFFLSYPNVRAGRQNVPTGIQYKVKNCSAGPPPRAGRQNFFILSEPARCHYWHVVSLA